MNKNLHKSPAMTLDVLVGIILMMTLVPLVFYWVNYSIERAKQRSAAEHLQTIAIASEEYLKSNFIELKSLTTSNAGVEISINDLIGDFLPDNFRQRNVYYQEYTIYFRQPSEDTIEGIVLTHNTITHDTTFNSVTMPKVANLLNGIAGHIPTGDIPGQSPDILLGSYGTWQIELSSMGITSPGTGNLGAIVSLTNPDFDFLYRYEVPGAPELNAMQTELDMTNHAIDNVSEINFEVRNFDETLCSSADEEGKLFYDQTEGLYICRNDKPALVSDTSNSTLIKSTTIAYNDSLIEKPLCPNGIDTNFPSIFVSPQVFSVGETSYPLASVQAWATHEDDTYWRVHLRVLVKNDEWIYPSADYAQALVLTSCTQGISL